jgi:hypothetical protein
MEHARKCYGFIYLYLLLTAIGLMPSGSVYKDKVHEHPQYNTVHIRKYKYMNITKHKKQKIQKIHEKTQKIQIFFPLWLYSLILGFGHLHETSRFISVTRSRTVSRTPWTGDQLIARHLLTAWGGCDDDDDDDDGEVGGMYSFGRGNRSTRRKPAPTPLCPPQIPLARPVREPRLPRWEASDKLLQLWRSQKY